ncbi:ETC complex I subunit conserved region [Tistlia consotensis]|uniref:ETC complex I subunit conserved region n=1 Tax=Tistlia consotensis USBA 355 TaxID=560819 RepID=A0A1Y6CTW4_9PROT|nr:ETC complex I subunit [Tistlia consotensis]SMF77623.1 ETC complex I subunit conserved region [Tistlia consotensis USBA 355]SNS20994.1 ETC complex I subunit conserved region [Tistlia consotensis]
MQVRIYQLPKTAMQSGRALTKRWVVEYEQADGKQVEPLMGWTSSGDTRQQLRLYFESQAEAESYARRHGLMYAVELPHERKVRPKAYGDNFRADRLITWTH